MEPLKGDLIGQQRQDVAGVQRASLCHGEDQVERTHGIDRDQAGDRDQRGPERRQGDIEEAGDRAGAVEGCGLVLLLRDGGEAGGDQDHGERRAEPDICDSHGSQGERRIGQPVNRCVNQMQSDQEEVGNAVLGGEDPLPQRAHDERGQDPG